MNTKEVTPYIFISYAHEDANIAKRITEYLQNEGFEVWIDYNNIRAGEKFNGEIAKAIIDSSLLIAVVSNVYISKDKDYCTKEITYAHNRQKNYMPVYIEKVKVPIGCELDFVFHNASQVGFNMSLENDDDFNALCHSITNSEYMDYLKEYMQGDTPLPMPYIKPDRFDKIKKYYQKIANGNYYLPSIETELFPPFKIDSKIERSGNNNGLLLEKIIQDYKTNFLIIGDGGSGKTVALRSIFRNFIDNEIPALYIPLNKIQFSEKVTIQSYLEDEMQLTWHSLKIYGKRDSSNSPLRLLFDGLNEIPGDRRAVLNQIKEIMRWDNVQIIISSRSDFSNNLTRDIMFKTIYLQPLEENTVKAFLEKKSMPANLNKKMTSLLRNPLMLMLYINTDMSMYEPLSKYSNYYKINISSSPSSEEQIMWNFLQSQLYRVDESFSSQFVCDAFVIIEFLLPLLANHMIINGKSNIDENELDDFLDSLTSRDDYKYYNNRLRKIERTLDIEEYKYKGNNLNRVLFNKLSLMVEAETGEEDDSKRYEFFHQSFRDFFAAMFVAKKLEMIANEKTTNFEEISKIPYEIEIIKYVAEISMEKQAKPVWTAEGLTYPGKNEPLSASSFSDAEKSLNAYRGLFDESAQNIVCNVYKIMSIGRDRHLSNCDFSSLDLRKCNLKGGYYSDWYCDNEYPSSFENSYIDLDCFISQGHQATIKSICEGNGGVFTADTEGTVKHWRFDENIPIFTVTTPEGAIISIDYSEKSKQLAILKQHAVYLYDLETDVVSMIASAKSTYRYIRFNTDDQIEVTYDTSPLTWTNLSGVITTDYLSLDIPCGCSAIDSKHTQILRSYLYGTVHRYDPCDNSIIGELNMLEKAEGNGITDIKFSNDDSRFLVGFGNNVFEFDSHSLEQLHKLEFKSLVNSVMYTADDKIVVATGVNIVVLNKDFSYYKEFAGESLPNIIKKLFKDDGKLYFLDTTGTIKLISDKITVSKTRKPWFKPRTIAFGHDGLDRHSTKMFAITSAPKLIGKEKKVCIGYDYEKNAIFDLVKDYEIFNVFHGRDNDEYEIHILANKIVAINKKTSERVLFVNYKGITIHGCNFKNILGSITEDEGIHLLVQNGGIVNE